MPGHYDWGKVKPNRLIDVREHVGKRSGSCIHRGIDWLRCYVWQAGRGAAGPDKFGSGHRPFGAGATEPCSQ